MPKKFDSEEERKKYFREKQALARAKKKSFSNLTAVPVLADAAGAMHAASSASGEARESTDTESREARSCVISSADSRGGSQFTYEKGKMVSRDNGDGTGTMWACPDQVEPREWLYSVERMERAKKYAAKFPRFIRPSDLKYQDPLWQWDNEVRGRFTSPVGGSLSGTRSQPT